MLFVVLTGTLLLSPALTLARQDQESVADAARKAQEEKKTPAKPAKVFTNDNLDTIKGQISVVGPTPDKTADAAPADDKAKAEGEKTPASKGEAYWKEKFAAARKKQADDEHELDVLQREFNLKSQQYYSDPNTAMKEQYSREDLNDTKTKIDDKTAAVTQDKQAVSDLEDDLRKAGGEPSWANPPSTP
jgi:chromosome segregation ATPase